MLGDGFRPSFDARGDSGSGPRSAAKPMSERGRPFSDAAHRMVACARLSPCGLLRRQVVASRWFEWDE